jgi:hypothetical protein
LAKIFRKSTRTLLKIITGKWCDKLYIADASNPEIKTLFLDVENEPICAKIVSNESEQDELESRRLWSDLTKFLKRRDYNLASVAKTKIEESQRQLARSRAESGISWHPKFFSYHTDGFWHFADHNFINENYAQLTERLNEFMCRRDIDFKSLSSNI